MKNRSYTEKEASKEQAEITSGYCGIKNDAQNILLPFPFFLALFIAGCSDRGGVPTGSGHTSPKDESDLSSGWTGVWKGTADYLKVDYQNYINNRFMDWRKDETCVIMITSYEPNYIYFNIQEPSPIQIFTSVQSDTSLFVFQKDKRFKYEIYAVKSNDEMAGIAVEYKYEPEYERGLFR